MVPDDFWKDAKKETYGVIRKIKVQIGDKEYEFDEKIPIWIKKK